MHLFYFQRKTFLSFFARKILSCPKNEGSCFLYLRRFYLHMVSELPRETLESLRAERKYPALEGKDLLTWASLVYSSRQLFPPSARAFTKHPLTGDSITYCPERAKRPHVNGNKNSSQQSAPSQSYCPICTGNTTPVVDILSLPTGGDAFVNFNLFPAVYPENGAYSREKTELHIRGVHLLIWPSRAHIDIDTLSPEDHTQSFVALQRLETRLQDDDRGQYMHAFKNTGAVVGSSLDHGHYQVILSNAEPGNSHALRKFYAEQKFSFAGFCSRSVSEDLVVKEYETARILTPPWMRKPLEIMVVPKDLHKERVSDLSSPEVRDFAAATGDVARALKQMMPAMGKEYAFNLILYSGKGIGTTFIEIIPYTQITGASELGGSWLCQSDLALSTTMYREWFEKLSL